MTKVLLTGADGFLGSKIFEDFSRDYDVYGTSRNTNTERIFSLDLRNPEEIKRLLEKLQPSILIHAAALVDVDKCEKDKDLAYQVNYKATEEIAKLCGEFGIKMIYLSTDYVFSGNEPSYSVNSKPNPINYYGETKLMGEEAVKKFVTNYAIIRPTILYGSIYTNKKNFVLDTISKIKSENEIILDNKRVKYPLLIDDVSKAVKKIIDSNFTGLAHLSGPSEVTKYDWGIKIAEVFSLSLEKIKGKNLNETNRPFKVKFEDNYIKALNLEEGLNLIKNKVKNENN